MTIAVLAEEWAKEEFTKLKLSNDVEIIYADSMRSFGIIEADAYFDLMFEFDRERTLHLKKIASQKPVVVSSVVFTCQEIGGEFIRLNAWPTMLGRTVAEVATGDDGTKATSLFRSLGWPIQMVPDVAGMITPRIISMIINEAFYALQEGVSSPAEIDEAMRLGTNYPYGPFEWLQLIGQKRVLDLLIALSAVSPRYTIAPALLNNTAL